MLAFEQRGLSLVQKIMSHWASPVYFVVIVLYWVHKYANSIVATFNASQNI